MSDSWMVAGSLVFDISERSYRLAEGRDVRRSWDSVSLHAAGGYRWLWPSRLYVLLGTGPNGADLTANLSITHNS